MTIDYEDFKKVMALTEFVRWLSDERSSTNIVLETGEVVPASWLVKTLIEEYIGEEITDDFEMTLRVRLEAEKNRLIARLQSRLQER